MSLNLYRPWNPWIIHWSWTCARTASWKSPWEFCWRCYCIFSLTL